MNQFGRTALIMFACAFAVSPKVADATEVRGQTLSERRFQPNPSDFNAPETVAVLHYYGAGGWGIRWRGSYLMTATYFSNHGIPTLLTNGSVRPDIERIRAGWEGTPAATTELILVGHGHIDHAGDIPGYFQAGLPAGQAGLIADASVVNMLAPLKGQFRCIRALEIKDDGRPLDASAPRDNTCVPPVFRVTPLHSAHAPHAQLLGINFEAFGGRVAQPRTTLPEHADDFKLGYPHAFLIDLLDAKGRVVFRIHYMDAAADPPHALIDVKALRNPRPVDVHIGCAPGFDLVSDYPEGVLESTHARFVLAAHWETFFKPLSGRLDPVPTILNEKRLNSFVSRIEDGVDPAAATLSPLGTCDSTHPCGPRGSRWAIPIPGETLRFEAR